ncbi:MAG: murein transglycosylase [Rhodospirillaceae bacterium]|nr:murein transglycosylase [Rhodospirillaceae bacterium]
MRLEARNKYLNFSAAILIAGVLASCSLLVLEQDEKPVSLTHIKINSLPGWVHGEQGDALLPFWLSCQRLMRPANLKSHVSVKFGQMNLWRRSCRKLDQKKFGNHIYARKYFEKNFRAYLVGQRFSGKTEGLFTGYYEPHFDGALKRFGQYQTPIYPPPDNLNQATGRYFSRKQINNGALQNDVEPIAWLKNPVDVFFLQIQGSGRIKLPNGEILRVGYAGHNRHPYTSIGKVLVDRQELSQEALSMQAIRSWLKKNPMKVIDLLELNARYIFFSRVIGLGPLGAQGVVLTPGRSLAIDPRFLTYGLPVWIDTKDPLNIDIAFQRLLITQDTGGAIRGAVRGDIFFGHGLSAAKNAGHMNRRGRYFVFIPK